MLLIVVMYFILSLIFLVGKLSVIESQPIFFIAMRLVVAGALMLGYEEYTSRAITTFWKEKRHLLKDLALLSFFQSYLNFVLCFLAVKHVSSIKFNLLWTTSPFITALIAHALYNEKLHFTKIMGIAVAFGAMLPNIFFRASGGNLGGFSWPELFILLGTSAGAYGWFLFRDIRKQGLSILTTNGLSTVIAIPFVLLTSYFFEDWSQPLFHTWPNFLMLLGAMVLIANVAYFNLYAYAIHHYPITFVTLCMFMTPLFGALLGWLLLGEMVGWTFYLAVSGVIVGLYLFSREKKTRAPVFIAPE